MRYKEFDLIEKIKSSQVFLPTAVEGIGDDASVIPVGNNECLVVTTDSLLEDIHFKRSWATAYQIGRKSVAVNLSDVAAMGMEPMGIFLSLSIPADLDDSWINSFIDGINSFNVPVLGGDTTSSNGSIFINITAIGKGLMSNLKRRSTAKCGDGIYVTGTLGDSGAGLYILENSIDTPCEKLLKAHREPVPCIYEGKLLGENPKVHSMMDLSDGLAGDLKHILNLSRLSAEIDCDSIPISDELKFFCTEYGLNPLKFALQSGEDYQLLFSADENILLPLSATKIGVLTDDSVGKIVYLNNPQDNLSYQGYTHF